MKKESKRSKIIAMLTENKAVKDIATELQTNRAYVYKIKKEIQPKAL